MQRRVAKSSLDRPGGLDRGKGSTFGCMDDGLWMVEKCEGEGNRESRY